MLSVHRLSATAAVAIGLVAPTSAGAQDLRSPDAQDAARQSQTARDLRSPDARDAARPGQITGNTRGPTPVRVVEVPASGFEWGDAAIGGAGTLAMVLIALAAGMLVTHRRRATRVPAGPR